MGHKFNSIFARVRRDRTMEWEKIFFFLNFILCEFYPVSMLGGNSRVQLCKFSVLGNVKDLQDV